MESHRDHRVSIAVIAIALLGAIQPVGAQEGGDPPPFDEPPTIVVDSNPDAVTVDAEAHGGDDGVSGIGTQASGSAPRCYLRNYPTSEWDHDMSMEFFYYRMRKEPWKIICDGEWRGTVWLPIPEEGGSTPGSAEPRDVAIRLRDSMPIPRVEIEINPSRGLVGAESWFWIDGYSGVPLTNSTDAFGELIEVEARVTRYEWSFGDGSTIVSETPGQAYPARSEVRHVYERSSLGLANGYVVEAAFVFAVRYRVNGGGWIELPGIMRMARGDYPVRESQSVIQR